MILADEVAEMAERHADSCRIEQVMSRAGDGWTGARGRIDRAYIEARFDVRISFPIIEDIPSSLHGRTRNSPSLRKWRSVSSPTSTAGSGLGSSSFRL